MKPQGASVAAVAAAKKHRFTKVVLPSITLMEGLGVDGDAHSGAYVRHLYAMERDPTRPNLRQIHLIKEALFAELQLMGFDVRPGQLGENITTRHFDLLALTAGSVLRIGQDTRVRITGLREPCVKIERFQKGLKQAVTETRTGRRFMKRAVMGVVTAGGNVAPGAAICVEKHGPANAILDLV